jgi:RNA polymerase sigma-70 factor (ECF subfamily)
MHNTGKSSTMAKKVNKSKEQNDEISLESLLYDVGKKKDRKAFITLFDHFAPRVKSYLLKQGCNETAAEEVVQDTMIRVWRKASMYDPSKAKASTWIFTIARNRRIDLIRKNSRSEFLSDAQVIEETHNDDLEPSAEDIYAQTEQADVLKSKISELPQEQLELLQMAFYQDKSHQEIADETKLPLGTVKSRIRLALGKLKKSIKGYSL